MDPNATLRLIAEHLAAGEFAEARHARTDLINWLARGGFEPDWATYPEATRYVRFEDADGFEIPTDWSCPTCGEHECPGCQPHPQNLSCFL